MRLRRDWRAQRICGYPAELCCIARVDLRVWGKCRRQGEESQVEEIPNQLQRTDQARSHGHGISASYFLQQASERASISTGTGWILGFGLFFCRERTHSLQHGKAAAGEGVFKNWWEAFSHLGFGSGPGGTSDTVSLRVDYIQYPRIIYQVPVLPDLPRQTDGCYRRAILAKTHRFGFLPRYACHKHRRETTAPPPTTARSPVQPHRPPRRKTNMLSRTSQCNLAPGSLVGSASTTRDKKRIAAEGNRVRPVRPFLVASNPPNRAEYSGRAGCGGPRWQLHCT